MYVKFASMIIAMCSAELFVFGTQSPSDSIYLFVSNNPIVQVIRLALAAALLTTAFKGSFRYKISSQIFRYIGIGLIVFGLIGMCSQFLNDNLATYIKLSDYILAAAAGFAFTICSLTLRVGRQRMDLKKTMLNRLPGNVGLRLTQSNKQKSAF